MSRDNFRIYFFCALFFAPIFVVRAQFVNEGDMIIQEGTKDVVTFFDFTNMDATTVGGTNPSTPSFINNANFYVMKNYSNDGIVDHDNAGTTIFKGGSKQSINGGNSTNLFNVVFDNTSIDPADNSSFNVLGDIYIDGIADFKKGIVNNKTTTGTIIFTESASTIGANDDSYVNGRVQKIGDVEFPEFPVGSYNTQKQYRYAGISAPPDVSHLVTAEYFLSSTNAKYPHSRKDNSIITIDNNEYWKVMGSKNLILTLSWDDDTTPKEFLDNPKAIRITRWDIAENRWVDVGGIVDIPAKRVTAPVASEGIFTLAVVNEEISDEDMHVYNAISPNDDGENDKFYIGFKDNVRVKKLEVKIFNRWGIEVYKSDKYQFENEEYFFGFSDGRLTVERDARLPSGTYFYILNYEYDTVLDGKNYAGTKVGYLYIADDPTSNGF